MQRFIVAVASLCALWLSSTQAAAAPVTITDDNSSFVLSHTAPDIFGIHPYTGEWFVDGRRILTYVSAPANLLDIPHHHADGHVAANQLHAAGQLLGGPSRGGLDVTGGLVYTVDGSASGSGVSRLVEFVELTLGGSITTPQTFRLAGFGFEPRPHGSTTFEVPDLSGLSISGTTLAFATQGSFSVGPFRDLTVLPFHEFVGFNTFSADITLNPGTTFRMITKLNVAPVPEPASALLLATSLAAAWMGRRRLRRG